MRDSRRWERRKRREEEDKGRKGEWGKRRRKKRREGRGLSKLLNSQFKHCIIGLLSSISKVNTILNWYSVNMV